MIEQQPINEYKKTMAEIDKIVWNIFAIESPTVPYFSSDAILAAAVEIWKHHHPWLQHEYEEEGDFND
jgi:hypothetical protein